MHVPRGHLRGSQSSERWPWPIGPPEGVPSEAVGARLPSSCSFDLTLRAPSRGALQGRGPGRPSPAPPVADSGYGPAGGTHGVVAIAPAAPLVPPGVREAISSVLVALESGGWLQFAERAGGGG